jgi:lysophospholipid acyltransferase (LPLAT)-like uncharacterized protein
MMTPRTAHRLGVALAAAVATIGPTLRLRVHGLEHVEPFWAAGRPVIYVVWHGRIVLLPWLTGRLRGRHRPRGVTMLASRSGDGALAAACGERFGLRVVRGSSSRGGTAAVRALVQTLRDGSDIALVPDGPRGPREHFQPGAVVLAALTGTPIVPVACAARPARRLASWDQMLLPVPFARCAVVFGAPLGVARDDDREIVRKDAERALAETTARADRLVSA